MGDIFELEVKLGYAYLQVVGRYRLEWVVRVIEEIFKEHVSDTAIISTAPEAYVIVMGFLPYEEQDGEVVFIGTGALPEKYADGVPLFKANVSLLRDGRRGPGHWWLDDGKNEWRVFNLTPEQQLYPYRDTISAKELAANIDRGWDPEWDFKGPDAREFQHPEVKSDSVYSSERVSSYYFIFPSMTSAEAARNKLIAERIIDEVHLETIDDDDEGTTSNPKGSVALSARVTRNVNEEFEALEDFCEAVALEFGGIYDGNEIAL